MGGRVLPHSKSWVRIHDLCGFSVSTLVLSQSKDMHGFRLTGDSTCECGRECWPLVQGVACFSLYDSWDRLQAAPATLNWISGRKDGWMDSSFKWLISVITYLLGVGGHACCCSWVFVSLFETQVGGAVLDGIPAHLWCIGRHQWEHLWSWVTDVWCRSIVASTSGNLLLQD